VRAPLVPTAVAPGVGRQPSAGEALGASSALLAQQAIATESPIPPITPGRGRTASPASASRAADSSASTPKELVGASVPRGSSDLCPGVQGEMVVQVDFGFDAKSAYMLLKNTTHQIGFEARGGGAAAAAAADNRLLVGIVSAKTATLEPYSLRPKDPVDGVLAENGMVNVPYSLNKKVQLKFESSLRKGEYFLCVIAGNHFWNMQVFTIKTKREGGAIPARSGLPPAPPEYTPSLAPAPPPAAGTPTGLTRQHSWGSGTSPAPRPAKGSSTSGASTSADNPLHMLLGAIERTGSEE
jgi:hypothetical protein